MHASLVRYSRALTRIATVALTALLCVAATAVPRSIDLVLADAGRPRYEIAIARGAALEVELAATELAAYLERISGAKFRILRGEPKQRAIVLRADTSGMGAAGGDAYRIAVTGETISLTGASPRATLYAAYDLLERLGCRWLAPAYSFYGGTHEIVPRTTSLVYSHVRDVSERPTFAMRELDVGQGSSHDLASMKQLIAWLPKQRLNQLQVPMTMGRASWDDWRSSLTPELERRGITLEVGGHGYQNFLNASMEGGRLFREHPEWFGLDAECRPSAAEDVVFNTENPDALAYFTNNVVRYVTERPEIDIFELWPPDVARWSECVTARAKASPEERQARLVNHVQQAVQRARPDLRLQVIAYQDALHPPRGVRIDPGVLVDFCPIDQSFDAPIDDSLNAQNAQYRRALQSWRRAFDGDIGVYTYYRKYAWRSLPVVIPHIIARDLRYYASVPVQGVSMYAEPADWFTYELNYLAFARFAWQPQTDADAVVRDYLDHRFGADRDAASRAYALLEASYRRHGSVPFSAADSLPAIDATRLALSRERAALAIAAGAGTHAGRLALMLELAERDLDIQAARTRGEDVSAHVRAAAAFMARHRDSGIVLARGDDETRLTKHYTRESQVLPPRLRLAHGGRTEYVISTAANASAAEQLAARELASYLERITGARFPLVTGDTNAPAIVLRRGRSAATGHVAGESYALAVRGRSVYLTGGSPRAVLFAAYDLLERLGCRWLAPALGFYGGAHETVPHAPGLTLALPGDVLEHPAFALRKLDVEEGLSHDTASLRAMVEWMPKLRYNVLQVPLDYGGGGRVRWDAWRELLTPELDRRDLLVEVGGHGFHNFLNPSMEEGRLFERHPEWFGRDAECRPSRAPHLVFDTENTEAVQYLVRNLVAYLEARPEIDIFDFWPPDGARWSECAEWVARGTPEDRQAKLVNQVAAAVRAVRPDVRLEIIAYAHAKNPPATVELDPGVLVDYCPIGQNFQAQIFDTAGSNNATYMKSLAEWRQRFDGEVGFYSYYRRYAWRSLPVILPRYMQRDISWWAAYSPAAVSTYAEPGDWGSYEVNHYVFGRLGWNPALDLDAVLGTYAAARYGTAAGAALDALAALEDAVRIHGSVPYSPPSTVEAIGTARAGLLERQQKLRDTGAQTAAVTRLDRMLEFAIRDLQLQALRAGKAEPRLVAEQVDALVAFLQQHADDGVFLLRGRGDLERYRRHYGLRED